MRFRPKKKTIWIIVAVLLVGMLCSFIWSNHQLAKMYGAHVESIDHTAFKPIGGTIAFINAEILSADGSHFLSGYNILFDESKVISVNQDSAFANDVKVVDASGKYIIPGLMDSHVHLFKSENDLLLYLVNGVTSIRELMGSKHHLEWRDQIEKGRIGPRMFVASNKLQSFEKIEGIFMNWAQGNINVSGNEDMGGLLKNIEAEGYDAVKLGSFVSTSDYEAIQIGSQEIDIPIIGHVSYNIDIEDVWESNQKEIAHIEEIVKSLFNKYRALRASGDTIPVMEFVASRVIPISQKLKEQGIPIVSTLRLMESLSMQKFALDSTLSKVELEYANPGILEGTIMTSRALGWLPDVNLYRLNGELSEEALKGEKGYWSNYIEAHHVVLQSLLAHEVDILAGTDANIPVMVPGTSLHEELKSLANAGMMPEQVLRSATAVPHNWIGLNAGTIAPGYEADLVILSANPLEDIGNTKLIEGVVSKGRYFEDQLLQTIRNIIKEKNNSSRKKSIDQFLK